MYTALQFFMRALSLHEDVASGDARRQADIANLSIRL